MYSKLIRSKIVMFLYNSKIHLQLRISSQNLYSYMNLGRGDVLLKGIIKPTFHLQYRGIRNVLAFGGLAFSSTRLEFFFRWYYNYRLPLESIEMPHFAPLCGRIYVCLYWSHRKYRCKIR